MDKLPEEILSLILAELQPVFADYNKNTYDYDEDFTENQVLSATLAAACQVNRTWYRVATPLLYDAVETYGSVFRVRYHDQDDPRCGPGNLMLGDIEEFDSGCAQNVAHPRRSSLASLLRTCAQAPSLIARLRHLRINMGVPYNSDDLSDMSTYDMALMELSIPQDLKDLLRKDRRNTRSLGDSDLAVLLPFCHNIDTLDIVCHDVFGTELVEAVLQALTAGISRERLPNLRTFSTYPGSEPFDGTTFREFSTAQITTIKPFLVAPAVETVRLSKVKLDFDLIASSSAWSTTVTSLKITEYEGRSRYEHHDYLLTWFPNLHQLHLDGIAVGIAPHDGTATLQRHGKKFESLTMIMSGWIEPLGSIAELANLRSFTTTRRLLQGRCWETGYSRTGFNQDIGRASTLVNLLPRGLEILRIAQCVQDRMRGTGEYTKAEALQRPASFWNTLHDPIAELCSDNRFKRLREVAFYPSAPFDKDLSDLGWTAMATERSTSHLFRYESGTQDGSMFFAPWAKYGFKKIILSRS